MAEPIRNYAPRRDAREELRRRIETAPVDYAEALIAWLKLLEEARAHGVLDTLHGAIGGGAEMIGKLSGYANTPEGIRLIRNLLAGARALGELDPAVLDAVLQALERKSGSASMLESLLRLAGRDGRRALGTVAAFLEALGRRERATSASSSSKRNPISAAAPIIAIAMGAVVASYWIGKRSGQRSE